MVDTTVDDKEVHRLEDYVTTTDRNKMQLSLSLHSRQRRHQQLPRYCFFRTEHKAVKHGTVGKKEKTMYRHNVLENTPIPKSES